LKIQDGSGRHHEESKNRHIFAAVLQISMKFGTMTQLCHLEHSERQNFKNPR